MANIELPNIDDVVTTQDDTIKDDIKSGVSMAYIGAGQGGCRIADAFYRLGKNRVLCINTTEQDMKGLIIEKDKQYIMDIGEGGAGKNPTNGKHAIKKYYENVFNKCREKWGKKIEQVMICLGSGGGCVDGKTEVLTKELGIISLENLFDYMQQFNDKPIFHLDTQDIELLVDNVHVLSSDTKGNNSWAKIASVWKNSDKGTGVLIKTLHGKGLTSEEHPYFVFNPETQLLEEKKAKDLKVGDFIYKAKLKIGDLKFDSLSWILGYFAGNGSIKKERNYDCIIRFSQQHAEVLEKAAKICREYDTEAYCKISPDKRQDSYELYVNSKKLFNLITRSFEFYGGSKEENLILPKYLKNNLNSSEIFSFFTGLIDSDGNIKKGRKSLDLAIAQHTLVKDLVKLLNLFELNCSTMTKIPKRENESPLIRLYTSNLELFDAFFKENLTFKKQKDYIEGISSRCDKGNVIPPQFFKKDYDKIVKNVAPDYYYNDEISRKKLKQVFNVIKEAYKDDVLASIGLQLEEILFIEECDADYYDLSVTNTQSYFASYDGKDFYLVHNTGSGCAEDLISLSKDYLDEIKSENGKVGVICSLPKRSEGTTVNKNAYELVTKLIELSNSKTISPLVIVDNEKIHSLFPNVSVAAFWGKANDYLTSIFDVFNMLAAQESEYSTFDSADYKDILHSGTTIFGMASLKNYTNKTDLADAVKTNLLKGLLAEGFDLTKAKKCGVIITADEQTMFRMPQEAIDLALQTVERTLGGNITMHNGVYEGNREGVQIFFIISGLDSPEKRIEELKRLGKVN